MIVGEVNNGGDLVECQHSIIEILQELKKQHFVFNVA